MSVHHQQTLRDRQVGKLICRVSTGCLLTCAASIEKILNLNQDAPSSSDGQHEVPSTNGLAPQSPQVLNADGEPIWKVLVFDNLGRDVISSVLRVNDLRSWGVTIHL
jgi:hypothetical protein